MKQRKTWVVAMLAVAVVVSVGFVAFGDEEKVSLEQLPPAVRATIEQHAAGGTIKEIEKETKNGVTVYEAEIVRDGKTFDVKVAADGKFLGTEGEEEVEDGEKKIALEEAPPAVQAAIRGVAGAGPIKEVVREVEDGVVSYEAEYEVNGVEHSVSCAASGEVIQLERKLGAGALPPVVLGAVMKKFPGATIKEGDLVQVFFYEVEVVKDGKTMEVQVFATGRIHGHEKAAEEDEHEGKDED